MKKERQREEVAKLVFNHPFRRKMIQHLIALKSSHLKFQAITMT